MDEDFVSSQDIVEDVSSTLEAVDDITFYSQNPLQGACTLAGELVDSMFWLSKAEPTTDEGYAWESAMYFSNDFASLSSIMKDRSLIDTLRLANDYPVKLGTNWYHSHVEAIHHHAGYVFRRMLETVKPNISIDELIDTKFIESDLIEENWEKLCQCWNENICHEVTEWEVHITKEYQRALKILASDVDLSGIFKQMTNVPRNASKFRLVQQDKGLHMVVLARTRYPVDGNAFLLMQAVIHAKGDWVNGSAICEGFRPDRARNSLPPELQETIESESGKGYRLKPEYW